MSFDPTDWLPLIGVAMLGGTTIISLAGAYALGRMRGERKSTPVVDPEARAHVEQLERTVEAMAIEIERIGEGQRFLIKVLGDKQLAAPPQEHRHPPRVITPH
jgi:hypothetical protein